MSEKLTLQIRALARTELPAATALLARGMRDNPLHVRVFGRNPVLRQRRLAAFLGNLVPYIQEHGDVLGAFEQRDLVGVLGFIRPGLCRPGLREELRMAQALVFSAPPHVLFRASRWLAIWAHQDPDEPHWHIGPLAVHPDRRRRGIGRQLMQECCLRIEASKAPAWLETDLQINVDFYRSLGFSVRRKIPVLGVSNWFMYRLPPGI